MTTSTKRREEDPRYNGPTHEILAPAGMFTDHVVYTKAGDLFTVLRLTGKDTECMEEAAIETIGSRFESALRILGPEYRVHPYLIKREDPDIPSTYYRRASMFSVDLYLVILRQRPAPLQAKAWGLASLKVQESTNLLLSQTKREARTLMTATESLCIQLADTVKPQQLDTKGTLRFLRSLINLTPWKAEPHGNAPVHHLDQYLCWSSFDCNEDHLKQDGYFVKILTMRAPPSQSFAHMLRRLLAIPSNMIVCSEWNRIADDVAIAELDKQRGHYHNAITSLRTYVFGRNPMPHEILLDDSKKDIVTVLNEAKKEIEIKQNHFGRFAYSVAVFDKSEDRLRQSIAKLTEVFGTYNAQMIEEGFGLVEALAAMIPGNYGRRCKRPMLWMLNQSHADLSPALYAPDAGNRRNEHLDKPALTVLETQDATPYFLNIQVGDVSHLLLVGMIGSGKTFLLKHLLKCHQQYKPYTVIFDLMGNYEGLTRHFGGAYLDIGGQSDVSINPFSVEPTEENLNFLFLFIRVLIEHGNDKLNSDERTDLQVKLRRMFVPEFDPATRRLSTLARTLGQSYAHRLDEWVGNGRLARYFDNATDTLSNASFQCYNFQGLDESQQDVLEPLLLYIFHHATQVVKDPRNAAMPKVVAFDEAFKFLKHPPARLYIHDALKTWRNFNAGIWLATQSLVDLVKSEMLEVICETCLTKIFLANPGMDEGVYLEAFKLNRQEAKLISGLIPKQQFLLKQGSSKVLNLFASPASQRILAEKNYDGL